MNPSNQPEPKTVSNCCSTTYHVEGSDEGTNGYYCDNCKQLCDAVPKQGEYECPFCGNKSETYESMGQHVTDNHYKKRNSLRKEASRTQLDPHTDSSIPDALATVGLRETVQQIMASCKWSEPGGIADTEALDQIMALFQADKLAAIREVLERLHRSEGEGLPKRGYDNVTDELIDEELARLQPPTAGEGESGAV